MAKKVAMSMAVGACLPCFAAHMCNVTWASADAISGDSAKVVMAATRVSSSKRSLSSGDRGRSVGL